MKFTSFLISKKLKEAGYVGKTDLETILDALPTFIANKNKGENCLVIDVAFGEIYYEGDSDNDAMFITTTEENESLADVAGKMWLMLKDKGIIC